MITICVFPRGFQWAKSPHLLPATRDTTYVSSLAVFNGPSMASFTSCNKGHYSVTWIYGYMMFRLWYMMFSLCLDWVPCIYISMRPSTTLRFSVGGFTALCD